jgi:C_GCAxxG_C_C family probable redox protein
MDDDMDRMREFKSQGFYCSQILLLQGMELQGKSNPDLVRSMQGLAGGLGFTGDICGALTGGTCLLGLYAGKGLAEEDEDPRLLFMIEDLVKWFRDEYGVHYNGIRCEQILNDDPANKTGRCPMIVAGTFQKIKDLLVENGFELSGDLDAG